MGAFALPFVLLLVLAGPARADPAALLDEASALLDEVAAATPERRVALLGRARDLLDEVVRQYPGSDPARAFTSGRAFRGIDPVAVGQALDRARTVPALSLACAAARDHACLLANAAAAIRSHRLGDARAELGRERARAGDVEGARALAGRLDADGEPLGASTVLSAVARSELAGGAGRAASRTVRARTGHLQRVEKDAARTHLLVSFAANLLGDGLADLATIAFSAAAEAAEDAIEEGPASEEAETVLRIYRAQALAGLGERAAAFALLDGLEGGLAATGWLATAELLARRGDAEGVRTIARQPAFTGDWRITSALVEAEARAGRNRTAVDLAVEASELADTRWLRLRTAAAAMADRGEAEQAGALLRHLEKSASPQQWLGLAELWRRVGSTEDAARLRSHFIDTMRTGADDPLQRPAASPEEAEAAVTWILGLARSLDAP